MLKSIASQWRAINLRQLVISLIIQSIIWWYVPVSYAGKISTATYGYNLAFLFLFTLTVAASAQLLFSTSFKSRFSLLTIIASFVLAFSGVINGKFVILLMLLLLPAFFLVLQIEPLQMQNEFGWLIYSLLATLMIPTTIFFFIVHFLSWTFIWALIPLWLSFLLFLAPTFMLKRDWKYRLFSLVSGILLIISILFKPIGISRIIAIVLVILAWIVMQNWPHLTDQYLKYSSWQLIVVLLIYL
ncbi:membrane protein [Paucilactobacillus hokkaidonensis JCM 18461]|uniref:Membrane protein n=2 Tax=Paucilactobacillus hokkaidonensis TaxID=1193095 RepID=A0A0A1GTM9_9LACO|nr:hypothetical protein [Paucilactobacillus hokkaidonensis]KRO10132.1 hypothetical protein IV59_GL002153 [Paucilactobacillus hokkaidonensis]BAP85355.1 membrane protein [Paucilactobacillus hokkaidonensis JCM 18461]